MTGDDELIEMLERSLNGDAPAAPPPERVAALRARAEASRWRTARSRRGTSPWLAAAALVIAIAAGFTTARVLDRHDDGVAGDVEYDGGMTGADGAPAAADLTVTAIGIGRVVELQTDALPILPTGEFYEVWFVAALDGPAAPRRISAGTFHPDPEGRSDVQLTAAVNPQLYPTVEISAEPGDGNPLQTGPIVLRAEIPG